MGELYRRRAGEVEANKLSKDNVTAVALWCGGLQVEEIDPHTPTNKFAAINVPTLHGVVRASEGDYIVKGPGGDFWPVKADIFEASYEIGT